MPNAATTVSKTKTRPIRFIVIGPDGITPIAGPVALASSNSTIVNAVIDPANPRRVLATGMNAGAAVVIIGSGPSALTVAIVVSEAPDLSRVDLEGFDDEI